MAHTPGEIRQDPLAKARPNTSTNDGTIGMAHHDDGNNTTTFFFSAPAHPTIDIINPSRTPRHNNASPLHEQRPLSSLRP
jgi:cyclophilin family peptidyl-prolyl cis-trans isomerase